MRILINLILTILLISHALYTNGQETNEQNDSLKKLINSTTQEIELINLFNQLSQSYINTNLDSCKIYALKAFNSSIKINYQKGLGQSLINLGIIEQKESNYSSAMDNFFNALKSAEKIKDHVLMAYALINIGSVNNDLFNYNGAIDYCNQAFKLMEREHDARFLALYHLIIGQAYKGQGALEQASYHLNDAKSFSKANENFEISNIIQIEIAELLMSQNQLDSALKILDLHIPQLQQLNMSRTLSFACLNKAKILINKSRLNEALEITKSCMTLIKMHKFKNYEVQMHKMQADVYEKMNDHKRALSIYKKYVMMKDSIFSVENSRKINSQQTDYLSDKMVSEARLLKQEKEDNSTIIQRQSIFIYLAALTALLFFILTVISYRSAQERKKLNEQINKQKETAFRHNNKLIDINNEKDNLIRILSHDLRAPISNIKGLTQMHQMEHEGQFSEDENNTLNLIKSESDRLLSMISKILNVEGMEGDKKSIIFQKVDITKIAFDVVNSYSNAANAKNIELKTHIPSWKLEILGDEIHMHQVLENLVSNALKFSEAETTIKIEVHELPDLIQIKVIDQGLGITKEDKKKIFKKFQTLSAKPTGNEESTGLGLSIVKQYVEEMNGHISYQSEPGKGTAFIVEFEKA